MCLESVRSARNARKGFFLSNGDSNPVDSVEGWRLYVIDLIHAISLVLGFLGVDNASIALFFSSASL
jgi:hypothetical protein